MKNSMMATVCAALLCAGTALAQPTQQENCDYVRVMAWKTYLSCAEGVIGKLYGQRSPFFDDATAFGKCRHAYFKKWSAFQSKKSLATSSCISNRFTDNLSGLIW
jgi:hypothetical protein